MSHKTFGKVHQKIHAKNQRSASMSNHTAAIHEYLDRPKGLADATTAAIWPLQNLNCIYMGSEVIKIVCGDTDAPESVRSRDIYRREYFPNYMSSTFTIHKRLLCQYSRFFREKIYKSLEDEIVANAVMDVEEREEIYLSNEYAPAGYIPSFVTVVADYRQKACEVFLATDTEQLVNEQPVDEMILLPGENKQDFVLFMHWVYTLQLPTDNPWSDGDVELCCVQLYGLAERLDVPALRRQCYDALHKYYSENNTMPEARVVQLVLKNCQSTSLLHKYMVATLAHEIINTGSESKESCDPILALDKGFAAEVALEIMDRLRADASSRDPNEEDKFDVDDSDSDVSSSIDIGSDLDYDSDGYMTISEGEEEESVVGDELETPSADPEAPKSVSELSTSVSIEKNAAVVHQSSPTFRALSSVRIEVQSPSSRALLDINDNKRKRASHSFGDEEGRQTKRLGPQINDDMDDKEIANLTQWALTD